MKKFRVTTVCTTDDPTDDLRHHIAIAKSGLETKILPAFRPDAALNVHKPEAFNAWLTKLEKAEGREVRTIEDLMEALQARCDYFHEHGCRLSDHGLERCYAESFKGGEIAAIFDTARAGRAASSHEFEKFASFMMGFLGKEYAARGWTMQLHLGALRNNNTRLLSELGPDTGFDSIGDFPQASSLSAFLNLLDSETPSRAPSSTISIRG